MKACMISCKQCKTKFEPRKINGINVSAYCKECQKERDYQKKLKLAEKKKKQRLVIKKRKKIEKKKNSPSVLTKKLDAIFSRYIRKRASDKNGKVVCVCCGKMLDWQDSQNAHYVGRASRSTRWDERNCHPNCYGCNVAKSGNYPAYTQYLLNNYGVEWLQELIRDGNRIKKWSVQELKDEIEKYTKLFNQL